MKEDFLHFLWELQYFNKTSLQTSNGEEIHIIHPGFRNKNSGPDFNLAKIIINGIEWHGQVEIHINSADWYHHNHDKDPAYENVILHVVWENEKNVLRMDGSAIPSLRLKERTDLSLVDKYLSFVNSPWEVPCKNQLENISSIQKISMVERALMGRLERKSEEITHLLRTNNNDWSQTTFNLLCKNFGFKINAEPFLRLSQNLPYKILLKHIGSPLQIESLLFGQAGFLDEEFEDLYPCSLKKEYNFLSSKYSLSHNKLNRSEWKFSKLRPPNFPTIRLSQLGSLLCEETHLFTFMLEVESLNDIYKFFDVAASKYWDSHYIFQSPSKVERKKLGKSSIDNVVINTIVPLLVCYSREKGQGQFLDKAVGLLESIKSEENHIITAWRTNGLETKSAADSQGLLELYNNYCLRKKCLDCSIGYSILNAETCSI